MNKQEIEKIKSILCDIKEISFNLNDLVEEIHNNSDIWAGGHNIGCGELYDVIARLSELIE